MLELRRLVIACVLVLAACGGGDAADDGSGDTGGSETTTTTTSMASTTTTTAVASNGNGDEFCQFAQTNVAAAEINPLAQTPEQLRETITGVYEDLQEGAQLAPDEIADDVGVFVEAYGGLVDFFDEYDWNFAAIPEEALDDSRLTRLDDEDINQAGENIEEYCGFEFIDAGPGAAPGPGAGPLPGAEIPEGFPSELIPPNGTVLASINVGSAVSVSWDVDSSLADLVAYYTDILGSPTATTGESALWVTTYEGSDTTVALQETDPNLVNMVVTYGE